MPWFFAIYIKFAKMNEFSFISSLPVMSVTPTTAELIAAICSASFAFNRRVDNLTLFNKIKSDHPNWDIDLAVLQRQLVKLGETNNNFGSSTGSACNESDLCPNVK